MFVWEANRIDTFGDKALLQVHIQLALYFRHERVLVVVKNQYNVLKMRLFRCLASHFYFEACVHVRWDT